LIRKDSNILTIFFIEKEVNMNFKELGLKEPLLKAIEEFGYTIPTPIQEQAIPNILSNKDVLGCAQTGTGKTGAFALPLIQSIMDIKDSNIKVLIITPTRELAIQIRDNFKTYGKYTTLKAAVVLGGVNQAHQIEVLKKGVDVLIATPGRLLDLVNQKYVKLGFVKTVVLDEADTMLDMGFIQDIKKIFDRLPREKQVLLFSATMPDGIKKLADQFLTNPININVSPVSSTVDKIEQRLYYVDKGNKINLLLSVLKKEDIKSALIFTRTKHGANRLAEALRKANLETEVIHGNKSQSARVNALTNFKSGKTKIMVATDIAARGIDISELSHVINYEIPNPAETYVHRIGRTGRAGLTGIAISFSDIDEKAQVMEIQKLIKQSIPTVSHEFPMMQKNLSPKKEVNSRPKAKKIVKLGFSGQPAKPAKKRYGNKRNFR
jgi:ATP-dependent RNA helicase RhlE